MGFNLILKWKFCKIIEKMCSNDLIGWDGYDVKYFIQIHIREIFLFTL